MIDLEALFKITYGLYIVSSGDRSHGNGYISNTIFQVTAEPPCFANCCNKDNFTASLIKQTNAFSVSILHKETPSEMIGRFGYKSGKDTDKLEGMKVIYGETGVPIVLNDTMAYMECRVTQTIDLGTHLMFIGELVQAVSINASVEPLTYAYYREVKKGLAPKNAPTYIDPNKVHAKQATVATKTFKCSVCGYLYEEANETIPFKELPDDYTCPICGAGKEDFIEI
jgi:flavin reductase (DIM6/NTAB) family NADH-FMN oxidoreductase RutF/rubredoxin